jgi:hypothetical protein
MVKAMRSELALAVMATPPALYSVLAGLSVTGIVRLSTSPFTFLTAIVAGVWLVSFLTPLALTLYFMGRLERRGFLAFFSFEVIAYIVWLLIMSLEGQDFPVFVSTYWLPPILTALFGYVSVKRRTALRSFSQRFLGLGSHVLSSVSLPADGSSGAIPLLRR